MGIFNKTIEKVTGWFVKEKAQFEIPQEENPQVHIPANKDLDTSKNYGDRIEQCALEPCSKPIETYEKRKTFNGKKYHRKCFKALLHMARKEVGV